MRGQRLRFGALVTVAALAGTWAAPTPTRAFCGFYVSGAEGSLYANATMVVLMRHGTRTVLSMQNDYAGPPQDFAMVVPVPVVLHAEDVRTLPADIFTRIDSLAAPRLVEYWEEDPCRVAYPEYEMASASMPPPMSAPATERSSADLGVRVEAEFTVGEYDIAILSASDSSGLETWLHREHYNIPAGAGEVLRPYVEAGTKFFVARVDIERVTFVGGRAVLSPLRVHYDTPELTLPVRLGLLNSNGEQDLIVHVLGQGTRFEAANYPNTTIPTNIRVVDAVRREYGGFYEYLFRETLARTPNAVVTEYSWDAGSCDPCPTPALDASELLTLGADVMPGASPYGWVLTRLHYRYTRDTLGDDLVFRPATPITGGRGVPAADGSMLTGATPDSYNQFQGRYVILHPWEGEVACSSPSRGSWGGPPSGGAPPALSSGNAAMATGAIPSASASGAFYLAVDVPEIGAHAGEGPAPDLSASGGGSSNAGGGGSSDPRPARGGCATCTIASAPSALAGLASLVLALVLVSRRRR